MKHQLSRRRHRSSISDMVHPALLILVSLPLTFRLIPLVVPARWLEPYAYWSAASLNIRPGDDGPRSQWRNMGWWMVSFVILHRSCHTEKGDPNLGHGRLFRGCRDASEEAAGLCGCRTWRECSRSVPLSFAFPMLLTEHRCRSWRWRVPW